MDLVEQQHKGIFSVLDEACMNVGKVTDEVFLQGLNGKLAKHAHYTSRKVGNTKYRLDLESTESQKPKCCLVFVPCLMGLNLGCDLDLTSYSPSCFLSHSLSTLVLIT